MNPIGKLWKAQGGRKGYWIAVGENPGGTRLVCLGLDLSGKVVSCSFYGYHYVERQTTIAHINVADIRFSNEAEVSDGRTEALDLSALFTQESTHHGERAPLGQTLVPP